MKRFVLSLTLIMSPVTAVAAPQEIGKFGDWVAYTTTQDGAKVCYMGSKAIAASDAVKQRAIPYFLITHRPANGETGVPSFTPGYTMKPDGRATIRIGGKSFRLTTTDAHAFSDEKDDKAVVQAMIRGAKMEVTATSSAGPTTKDVFSLKGVTAAHRAIGKACGVS